MTLSESAQRQMAEMDARRQKGLVRLPHRSDVVDVLTGDPLYPPLERINVGWWASHRDHGDAAGGAEPVRHGGVVVDVGIRDDGTRYVVVVETKAPPNDAPFKRIEARWHQWDVDDLDPELTVPTEAGAQQHAAKLLCGVVYASHRLPWLYEGLGSDDMLLVAAYRLTEKGRGAG